MSALGFVELDEHALGVMAPVARARASSDGMIIPLFSN